MKSRGVVPEAIFLVVVIVIGVGVILVSQDFPFRAFLLPIFGVVPAAILAAVQLIRLAMGKPSEANTGGIVDFGVFPPSLDDADIRLDSHESEVVQEVTATLADERTDRRPGEVAAYSGSEPAAAEPLSPHWQSFVWMAGLVILVYSFGMSWGALVFTALFMRLRGKDSFLSISAVLAFLGLMLFLMVGIFDAPLYRGVIF